MNLNLATQEDFANFTAGVCSRLETLEKGVGRLLKKDTQRRELPQREFVSTKFLVAKYGLTPRTAANLAAMWKVPTFKPCKVVLYRLEDFDRAFRASEVNPLAV